MVECQRQNPIEWVEVVLKYRKKSWEKKEERFIGLEENNKHLRESLRRTSRQYTAAVFRSNAPKQMLEEKKDEENWKRPDLMCREMTSRLGALIGWPTTCVDLFYVFFCLLYNAPWLDDPSSDDTMTPLLFSPLNRNVIEFIFS